jgi:hypothetical protein
MSAKCVSALLAFAIALPGCGGSDPPEQSVPCDVNDVLVHVCQRCHSSPPADGVPISLVTYADTQASYSDMAAYDDTPVWKVMRDEVSRGLMPEPPVVLGAKDRSTLLDWLSRGAPPAPPGTACP